MDDDPTLDHADWRKARASGANGAHCVEVATNLPDIIAVRDSKNPNGPTLRFTRTEWATFLRTIKGASVSG
ncbi:DUF397 domain-containing protein [Spongiactinospora sp. TRM90649]|uniref:DUF397 domain-containing protein n=1 Tax=Spongiactinospora sp. TRM90649 TaxID=3031114 RepID=UPI0023F94A2C|nr:DUF397 domain-containing protein [Spongiactinospora sp. TRM90649]MDF5751839.1 DUF397 domain-containing protein [Spongiactinospora sp. TRM90649]